MTFLGLGVISPCGRGTECHQAALECGSEGAVGTRVAADVLKDRAVLKNMRRADRFSRMAVLAAHDALADAGIAVAEGDHTLGLVVTTGFGPHDTTFSFIDDILDYGDAEVSPIKFSNSVHNAAAHYIAAAIGSRGPTTTLTGFRSVFAEGLALAQLWLTQEVCTHVLVGYVETLSEPMAFIDKAMGSRHRGRNLQPFSFSLDGKQALTEGAIFVVLDVSTPNDPQPCAGTLRDLLGAEAR